MNIAPLQIQRRWLFRTATLAIRTYWYPAMKWKPRLRPKPLVQDTSMKSDIVRSMKEKGEKRSSLQLGSLTCCVSGGTIGKRFILSMKMIFLKHVFAFFLYFLLVLFFRNQITPFQ